jgi:hypothetical protein
MSYTLYAALVPTSIRILSNLSKNLDKAAAYAAENDIDPATLVNARFAADMFPLSRQIQLASDTVKKAVARLTATEAPVYEDNETTIVALQIRIHKTIDYLKSVPESAYVGAEDRALKIPMGPSLTLDFTGQDYTNQWVIPNFYFHVTTAYDLLRSQGVSLGKRDFLG